MNIIKETEKFMEDYLQLLRRNAQLEERVHELESKLEELMAERKQEVANTQKSSEVETEEDLEQEPNNEIVIKVNGRSIIQAGTLKQLVNRLTPASNVLGCFVFFLFFLFFGICFFFFFYAVIAEELSANRFRIRWAVHSHPLLLHYFGRLAGDFERTLQA
jgi:cell division septum initiation protein DivIVA